MTERTATVRLRAVVSDFTAAYARAGTSVKGLQKEIQTGSAADRAGMEKVSRGALLLGGAALAGVGMAVKAFADFDHQMSAVHAATQAGTVAMGQLRDAAIEAGQKTVFSATEAAQAETELAKAGLSTAEILGGALGGALSLASAGSLEVADAAEIAATAMTQFGLHGKDVPHIADLLAAGAGKAQGEVGDLAEALKYVGPVAHGMGVSIEQTTGVLAEFAKKGIIGEQAGTGLRGVLLSMTSPSKQASAEMAKLGINLYDANGQFVGLDGVAGQLRDTMGGLSPKARDAAFGIMFGNTQVTAARVLYEGGATAVDKWTKAVDDQGYAAKVAADKMDNLTGDLNNLQSSLETALIKSGSSANTTLRVMAQSTTGLVNNFAGLPGPLQATAVGFTAVAAAVLLTGGAIGFLGPKMAATRTTLEGLGPAGVRASAGIGLLGKASVYAAGTVALGMAVQFLSDKLTDLEGKSAPAVDALTNSLVKFVDSGTATGATMTVLGANGQQLSDDLGKLGEMGIGLGLTLNKTSFGVFNRDLDQARDRVDAIDKSLADLVTQGHPEEAKAAFDALAASLPADQVDEFKAKLNDYTAALDSNKTQTTLNAGEQKTLAPVITDVEQAAIDAAAAMKLYTDSLDDTAAIDAYTANAQLAKSFHDLSASLKDNGKVTNDEKITLGGFATDVKATTRKVFDLANKTHDLAGSQAIADGAMDKGRGHFIKLAEKAGYSAKQAKHLADNLGLIHSPKPIDIQLNTAAAEARLASFRALFDQPGLIYVQPQFGAPTKGPHKAVGGPVQQGRTYTIGEHGEEQFTPWADGFITPHGAFARTGTTSFGNLQGTTPGKPTPLAQPKIVTGSKEAQDLGDGFGKVTAKVRAALKAIEDWHNALSATTAIDAFTANANLAKSFHDLSKSIKTAGKVTNDEKISLGGFAGEVKSAASAVYDLTHSQAKANAAMNKGRGEFIDLAIQAGYSKKQARALASRLGLAGRAAGGSVAAGTTYKVGESGTELFTPTTPGYITSNGAMTRATGGGSSAAQRMHPADLAALAQLIARRPDTVITLDRRVLARAVDAQNHDDRLLR